MKKSEKNCPTEVLLARLSGPWTFLILLKLAQLGPIRFGALKREVSGISSRMLTERLRMLEAHGFVIRDYEPTVPPKVSYALSAKGCELRQLLRDLEDLARKWQVEAV